MKKLTINTEKLDFVVSCWCWTSNINKLDQIDDLTEQFPKSIKSKLASGPGINFIIQ